MYFFNSYLNKYHNSRPAAEITIDGHKYVLAAGDKYVRWPLIPITVNAGYSTIKKPIENNIKSNVNFSFDTTVKGDKKKDNIMDILEKYKKYLSGEYTSYHTKADYYCHVKQFIEITKGIFNKDTIMDYKIFLNNKYDKRNTRNKKIIAINQFLKWLDKKELLMKNIGWENPNKPILNDSDISKILDVAFDDPELYLIVMLLWDGCLRDETIINLKIGNKVDNKLFIDRSKTGKKSIIMSSRLIAAWDRYLKVRPRPLKQYKEYLLINVYKANKGKKFCTIGPIINRISDLGKKCKLEIPITPYTIRRTRATLAFNNNSNWFVSNPKVIQKMFNHTDILTTLKYDKSTEKDVEQYFDTLYKPELSKYNLKNRPYKESLKTIPTENYIINECEDNNSYSFFFSFDEIADPAILNFNLFVRMVNFNGF